MFNANILFRERLSAHIKELSRYLRYILNGHTAIAMVFLISVLAVYYQQWLAQLSPNFPAPIIIAVMFGLLMTITPINTLLKSPDLVFLTVSEHKMYAYFRQALIYSYVVQLYVVFLVVAALGPLYFHAFPDRSGKMYLLTLLVLLILKACNMMTAWTMLKVRDKVARTGDQIGRFVIGTVIIYFLIHNNFLLASIFTIFLFVTFLVNYMSTRKNIGVNWEFLVERDQNKKQFFYRMASMFVDVPHLTSRVRRRRLLTSYVNKSIPFAKDKTYDYLYRLTFLRSGDYLQMYIRLIVIGSLLIYFVPNDLLKLAFALLFIYMSNFQMVTLYHHHRIIVWLDLYPVHEAVRARAFLSWLILLTAIQTVLFACVFLIQLDYLFTVITLIGGSVFNVLFNFKYVKGKIAPSY